MLHLVIPIYNEEENIKGLLQSLRSKFQGMDYRIVAVNDGSIDQSASILQELKDEDLTILSTKINMNVGAAFSAGILNSAKYSTDDDDILLLLEGDQTSSLDVIFDLVQEIMKNGMDIVIASRYAEGGGFKNFPFYRKILSQNASRFMRFWLHPSDKITDYSIFFRAYRMGVLKKAIDFFGPFGLIQSRGFVGNAELLVKLSMLTDRISEVPFVYDYGKKEGKSKIRIFRTIIEYFLVISYLRSISKKLKRHQRLSKEFPQASPTPFSEVR